MGKVILIVLAVLLSLPTAAKRDNDRRVILIMVDGLRWQDVYTGADAALVANNKYTRNKRCIKDFIGIDDTTLRFRVPQDCATHEFFLEPYNGIHFSRYAVYLHLKEK